jgi:hypothetical protein
MSDRVLAAHYSSRVPGAAQHANDALLNQDLSKLSVRNDPGSAVHRH